MVLRPDARKLETWLDIPYCKVGDLYHMSKLAAALVAAGAAR